MSPWSDADFGNVDAHADAEINNHHQNNYWERLKFRIEQNK
jgi:hypothetical protein